MTGDQPDRADLDRLDHRDPLVERVETSGSARGDLGRRDDRDPSVERVETSGSDRLDLDRLEQRDRPTFRRGVRLALDWGKARIGVAACDADGTLAYPVETVRTQQASTRIPELLAEYDPIEVIVGLPRTLAGDEGLAAEHVRQHTAALMATNPQVSWRFSDERLTTVAASRRLRSAGRDARRQRAVIDQAAAVAILEQALAVERATGTPPGESAR